LLRYDNGFTTREIAAILNIEVRAVSKRLTRAKARLKELLREGGYEV
jgi:DNA-directed RNA polymerase specialized sigma24 family protein